jgi:hypothetical protein
VGVALIDANRPARGSYSALFPLQSDADPSEIHRRELTNCKIVINYFSFCKKHNYRLFYIPAARDRPTPRSFQCACISWGATFHRHRDLD